MAQYRPGLGAGPACHYGTGPTQTDLIQIVQCCRTALVQFRPDRANTTGNCNINSTLSMHIQLSRPICTMLSHQDRGVQQAMYE